MSRAFVPLAVGTTAAGSFSARLTQHVLVPGVSVTEVRSDASDVHRTAAGVRAQPRDDLLLSWQLRGVGSVHQHERTAPFTAGSASVYTADAPYSLRFASPIRQLVVQLPRTHARAEEALLRNGTARVLPRGPALTALTAVLSTFAEPRALTESPSVLPPDDAAALAESITALLPAVLAAVSARAPLDDAVLHRAIRADVDRSFANPLLSPESLAARHHLSLRQLQRLFARYADSPAGYLRRRRLLEARRMLGQGHRVAAAATACGFQGPDVFARAFKREFGVTPSQWQAEQASALAG